MYKILRKEVLNDAVELMEIYAPYVAKKCEPGQFIILRVGEDGERIPLTIADYDREKETITIIYQIVGYSTRELSKLNEGDELTDFVGPLGVPTKFHDVKHVIGVAGGVGSAPLYPQLRELANRGVEVDVIMPFYLRPEVGPGPVPYDSLRLENPPGGSRSAGGAGRPGGVRLLPDSCLPAGVRDQTLKKICIFLKFPVLWYHITLR